MSDTTDYLKYVTDRTLLYFNEPAEERRERRRSRREPWLTKWFGMMLPMGLQIWWMNRTQDNKPRTP